MMTPNDATRALVIAAREPAACARQTRVACIDSDCSEGCARRDPMPHLSLADCPATAQAPPPGGGTRRLDDDAATGSTEIASISGALGPRSDALRPALQRFFGRKGIPPGEIDDLVQEVFLRIIRRGGTAVENIDGYARAVAMSVVADRGRSRASRMVDAHVSYEPDLHGSDEVSPHRVLEGRIALRDTTRILLELPELTRRVFVLRRLEGFAFNEITMRLGISLSAAEKHMLRATRHLVARSGERP